MFRHRSIFLWAQAALAFVFALVALVPTSSAQRVRMQRVNIESNPPGATVFVDSTDSPPLGVTPLRRIHAPRGSHILIFRLARHEEARQQVNIRRRNETFTQTLNPLGEITVTAANQSAQGATVRIDGQPVGTLPAEPQIVQPGRHLIQVEREGFVTFTQWVQVGPAQQVALPVLLERQAPETGSVLVAADVSGASIFIDGEPRGTTPTLIENVPAGIHQVEVRMAGMTTQSQSVEVRAGESARVVLQLRPEAPPAGTLVVVTQPPGATVILDGEVLGEGPVTREGVAVGEHILEVNAQGFETSTQPVAIEAGQRRAIQVRLTAVAMPPGSIIVRSSAPNAVVVVDGEERGAPPVVVEGATAGTHGIVVRAPGFEEFRTTCSTGPGQNCEVDAELGAEPVSIIVRSNVPGSLYVDGQEIGPVPYEGTVPSGNRRVEVRAPGYQPHVRQVQLVPSTEPRLFDVALVEVGAMTAEERADEERRRRETYAGQTSYAANTIPSQQALIDLSVGYPHWFELRAATGFSSWLDGGIALRGHRKIFEFEARMRGTYRATNQVGVGLQVHLGGGIGPSGRNSFFGGFDGIVSILFAHRAAFSLWAGFEFFTDKYTDQINPITMREFGRDLTAQLSIGGSFEVRLSDAWNIFAIFEGVPTSGTRSLNANLFGGGNSASHLHGRLGFTFKFH